MPQRKMSSSTSDIRFALVPKAGCVCPICILQASRGFVFRKEFNPHGGNNTSCKCKFVAGVDGITQIEGYDPDKYMAQRRKIEQAHRLQ